MAWRPLHDKVSMNEKTVPFSRDWAEEAARSHPTPFYVYDEKAIRSNARALKRAFDWVPGGFMNYFAVKALPNPYIMKVLREEGMGADASSLPELLLAEKVGLPGAEIMFTSNDTPAAEFRKARELGAIINLDDLTHVEFLEKAAGVPELVCLRYNPGPLKAGNAIIGKPEEAKYGFTRPQIIEGYRKLKAAGARRFGLHTMVASNELSAGYFVETAVLLFELAVEVQKSLGIRIEFVNLGGGIGIPYRLDQQPVDLMQVSKGIKAAYERIIVPAGLHPLRIVTENGRMVSGPFGYLVSRVLHRKHIYRDYVGLDACMANLMRPGMYGAYHHITVLGKETVPPTETCDVTGGLCENNDKFAVQRSLPRIDIGDLVVIHDAGAHGHAMGFNYNGKLRCAELLLREDGSFRQIRRAETVQDYFATLDFSGL
jgi:diaminopimelate decarboxylase